jgi:hypothetical protein
LQIELLEGQTDSIREELASHGIAMKPPGERLGGPTIHCPVPKLLRLALQSAQNARNEVEFSERNLRLTLATEPIWVALG